LRRADEAFEDKQYGIAVAAYRAASSADATNLDAHYRLGVALAATGDLAGAIHAWEDALLVDPRHERARRNIELARERLARKATTTAVDRESTLTRVRALVADGRAASALRALDGMLADASRAHDPDLLALRADVRLQAGDSAGSAKDWLAVLAVDARRVAAYRGLGDAYAGLGDKGRARYFYSEFLRRATPDITERELVDVVRHRLDALSAP
jgi:tetratricopeptide (TPR) repeat protein